MAILDPKLRTILPRKDKILRFLSKYISHHRISHAMRNRASDNINTFIRPFSVLLFLKQESKNVSSGDRVDVLHLGATFGLRPSIGFGQ